MSIQMYFIGSYPPTLDTMGEVGVSRGIVDNGDEDSDDINSLLSAVVMMVRSAFGLANERVLLQDEDTPAAWMIACSSLA